MSIYQKIMKENESFKSKITLLSLIISFIVGSVIFAIVFLIELYAFNRDLNTYLYLILVDSFSIAGLLLLLSYFLSLLDDRGAFMMLSYSIKLIFYTIFISKKDEKIGKNYSEYKLKEESKDKKSRNYLLFSSLFYLFFAFIFLIVYYSFRPGF